MKVLVITWLLQALSISALRTTVRDYREHTQIVPSTVFSGNVEAETISKHGNLDGPQLSAINSSSYQWWYFDAVSNDHLSSITIVFYTALASGFGFIPPTTDVTVVELDFLFPNGTTNSILLSASEAVITTEGQGSSAVFKKSGARWEGSPDLSRYTVKVNAPESGVVGNFRLNSLAPAHYSCGKAEAGQPMMVAPNIGWSNAIPDSAGDVDFTVNGEKFNFQGSAYHDHNWGAQPFQANIIHEHWGRGRLGDYSIVWSIVNTPDGKEYATIYVAADHKILTASCQTTSFNLTSLYADGNATTGTFTGYALHVDLDNGDSLDIQVNVEHVALNFAPLYLRWIGNMSGRLNGGDLMSDGVALFEEFHLSGL